MNKRTLRASFDRCLILNDYPFQSNLNDLIMTEYPHAISNVAVPANEIISYPVGCPLAIFIYEANLEYLPNHL